MKSHRAEQVCSTAVGKHEQPSFWADDLSNCINSPSRSRLMYEVEKYLLPICENSTKVPSISDLGIITYFPKGCTEDAMNAVTRYKKFK
jgi:hypothetical protein